VPEEIILPFGTSEIAFKPPAGLHVQVAVPKTGQPLNLHAATASALANPFASPPLVEMARLGQKVCIVFTDATRDVPDEVLAGGMLAELARAGVRPEDILLLCGVGMHRPSTPDEKLAKLGAPIVSRYRVEDSRATVPSELVELGEFDGIPLSVNRRAADADLLLATGIVEPHQYAGFSGGRKTLAIGAGGEATIAATHSPAMIDRPGVRLGNIAGNPFHEAITESARRAGLRFIVNVLKDAAGRVVSVAAGEPTATFSTLVEAARPLYECKVDRRFDIVVAGVGHPKDANLYQASRAATYVHFAPEQVLKPGGVLIIPAPCEEGVGQGVGEQRFYETMRSQPTATAVLDSIRSRASQAGEQRAYMLAKVLQECRVIFVGTRCPEAVAACHMTAADDLDQAINLARTWTTSDADVLVVPHSLLTVLRRGDSAQACPS
jgi:nickel-dependent lactate racemase